MMTETARREMTKTEQKEFVAELYGMSFDDVFNRLFEAALRSGRISRLPKEERENWRAEMRLAVDILMKYIKIRDIQVMTYPEIIPVMRGYWRGGVKHDDEHIIQSSI